MLWRIEFADHTLGWMELGTGAVFFDDGTPLVGGVDYSTIDTEPPQPGWYNPTPPPPPPPSPLSWSDALPEEYYWIDVGPFFDRFGAAALAVTSSTNNTARGLVTLILPRKYVDLKRPDLPLMVGVLMQLGLIDQALMNTVLSPITTEQERHIKGLQQPES